MRQSDDRSTATQWVIHPVAKILADRSITCELRRLRLRLPRLRVPHPEGERVHTEIFAHPRQRGDLPTARTNIYMFYDLSGGVIEPGEQTPVLGRKHQECGAFDRGNPPCAKKLKLVDIASRRVQPGHETARCGVPQLGRPLPGSIIVGDTSPGQQTARAELGRLLRDTVVAEKEPVVDIVAVLTSLDRDPELAAWRVPQSRDAGQFVRDYGAAVRAKAAVDDPLVALPKNGNRLRGSDVPEPGGVIFAEREQRLVVRAKRNEVHRLPVVGDRRQQRGVVLAGGDDRGDDELAKFQERRIVPMNGGMSPANRVRTECLYVPSVFKGMSKPQQADSRIGPQFREIQIDL